VNEEAGASVLATTDDDGFAVFLASGERVSGEFRCAECRYGICGHRTLPICPMCGGRVWERSPARA
jgi:hypothetical protein